MVNYQLYRSNVLLGGQMKWDIIIDELNGNLMVTDFHLSPISRRVPYNKYNEEQLLNYSHQENVKRYYNEISTDFYKEYGDPNLESIYPIISNDVIKTHDDTFEMGCRRMQSYQLYNKQFEFFCPIWLEKLGDNQYISFEFEVKSAYDANNTILRREFELKPLIDNSYHNRFVDYIKNYISLCGINTGNDKIIYVDLDNGNSTLSGLDVSTGIQCVKPTNISDNILGIERPLMETDNIIITSLMNNKLISNQLFNFNICFNPKDIIPDYLLGMLGHDGFVISVNVKIKEGELEEKLNLVDFYSNYEYIPRKYCGPVKNIKYSNNDFVESNQYDAILENNDEQVNVLSYLKDHKCVDLIDKNKIIQSTIHWSLADSNDYIFNVYPGFAGYYFETVKEGDKTITKVNTVPYRYDDTPDIFSEIYDKDKNNAGWCNILDISALMNRKALIKYTSDIVDNGSVYQTVFKPGIRAKHILCPSIENDYKYNVLSFYGNESEDHRIMFDSIVDYIGTGDNSVYVNLDKTLYFIISGDGNTTSQADLFIYASDITKLTFQNVLKELKAINSLETRINSLILVMEKMLASYLHTTTCLSTLQYSLVKGPSLNSTEICFRKVNKVATTLLREHGNIRPTFIFKENDINFNYRYTKRVIRNNKQGKISNSAFLKHIKTDFLPLYPSVGFFAYDKVVQEYDKILDAYNEENPYLSTDLRPEYNSFNINKIIDLQPVITCVLESEMDGNRYKTVDELVTQYLREYYNTDSSNGLSDGVLLNHIDSLYEHSNVFEYKYDANGYPEYHDAQKKYFKYNYSVQIRLK